MIWNTAVAGLISLAIGGMLHAQLRVSNGGGYSKPPWVATFSSATSVSVPGSTHGQGLQPVPSCWEESGTTFVPITLTAAPITAANGNIAPAWSGTKTGYCLIFTGNGGGLPGPQGPAGQGVDPVTGDLNIGDGSSPGSISRYEATANGNNYRRREAQASFAESLTVKDADVVPTVPTVIAMTAPSSGVATEEYLTRSGNGTAVATTSGALTSGRCLQADAAGNVTVYSTGCGGGSSSTGYGSVVSAAAPANGSFQYLSLVGTATFSTNVNARSFRSPLGGTFSDLCVVVQQAATVTPSNTVRCTLLVDGTASSLLVDIPAAAATGSSHCSTSGLTATVAAGNHLVYRCLNNDPANSSAIFGSTSVKQTL